VCAIRRKNNSKEMNVKKNININEWETMCEEEKKEGGGTRAKNIGCDKTQ